MKHANMLRNKIIKITLMLLILTIITMGKTEILIAAPNARNVSALIARVRKNRENKRFEMQEEAYGQILNTFYSNQSKYNVLAKSLVNNNFSIELKIISSPEAKQDEYYDGIVTFDQLGINSKLSDEKYYPVIADNKEILQILNQINEEGNIYLISADEGTVSFVLRNDFVEIVTVSYCYYENANIGGYLTNFRLRDNWGLNFELRRSCVADFNY